ncbi:DNA polymerase Y family protein [Streptomyces sanyensis]|uniref:DNA polymerase Y family protein n=1 Tax=Streptomyces sanyensis TaxID=568869 RepID=UPI003D76D0C0
MILYARFLPPPMHEAALPALLAVAEDISPVVQALPPDAVLVDAAGAERYFGRGPAGLAALLRVRLLAHCGVDCVIGVGPGPVLARMAAREAAPGAVRVVAEEEAAAFLADKPVAALPGVGAATARTLCGYGLDTVGGVAAAPLGVVQRLLGGRAGREVWERARGIDRSRVVPGALARSMAGERHFPRDELDRAEQRRALLSLAEELGARMRGERQVCRSLTLSVRCADRSVTTRSRTLREPSAYSGTLTATAYALHGALGLQRARVRGLALRAEGLMAAERASRQLTFDPADERARLLEAAADRVRARFGPGSVVRGATAA